MPTGGEPLEPLHDAIAVSARRAHRCLRDVVALNGSNRNVRIFGPDDTGSNRMRAIVQATGKQWMATLEDVDVGLADDGRVMEILSAVEISSAPPCQLRPVC